MSLDLSPLARALAQLEAGLAEARALPASDLLRDGVIQRFEYSYELAHKMLRRHLASTEPSAEAVAVLTFPDLIPLASERGLLENGWEVWRDYRTARGTTSHVYDAAKAAQVYRLVPGFLADVQALLRARERRADE